MSITGELERLSGQQMSELVHMKKDNRREFELMDEKCTGMVIEMRNASSAQKDLLDATQRSSETRMLALMHKATDEWNNVMVIFSVFFKPYLKVSLGWGDDQMKLCDYSSCTRQQVSGMIL